MSKTVRAVAGAALIVVGAVTGNVHLIIAGASLTAGALTGPKLGKREATAAAFQLGETPRVALLGEVMTYGSLANGFNHGGDYGTDWEVLDILLADHRCDALVGFYVNDRYIAFTGNGQVAGYGGKLTVSWYPGTADQPVDPLLAAHGGAATTDRATGVCHVVVAYQADKPNAKNPVWPGGRPRFGWVVRGKRCYDPRKDSTVTGGAGPHRWSEPSTWEWTDNLAVCRYNWVRGIYACDRVSEPGQLLVGRGLSAAEAPPERVAAAANVCDELVPLASGGAERRYRTAASIGAAESFAEVEEKWRAASAGMIAQPEGSIEVVPGQAQAPVAWITDDDLLIGRPVTFSEHRSEADQEWCNTVVARYPEPSQKWAQHSAPVRRDLVDLIADAGPRERTLDLDYCRSGTQAQRCAEIARRMGRLLITAGLSLGPRFAELEEGDWIVWTSARRTKGLPVTFRIEAYQDDAGWQKALTLRQIAASVFDWTISDEQTDGSVAVQQPTPPPSIYDPVMPETAGQAGAVSDGTTTYTPGKIKAIEDRLVRLEEQQP